MAVPSITTTNIATFAWYRQTGCTEVTLADCLGILHSYDQYTEYVDGTIKIFDSGAESAAPDNYNLVNVRIRKDGYILAWFAQELTPIANQTVESATATVVTMSTTKCQIQNYHDSSARDIVVNELAGNVLEMTSGSMNGNKYTIQSNTATTITLHDIYGDNVSTDLSGEASETFRIYSSRGNLVWWGHTSSAVGDPTNQSTRLGRALYEIWELLKTNQVGGSGTSLDYIDVNYYDYEYTSATSLFILGYNSSISGDSQTDDKYYHFTVPSGRSVYDVVINYGSRVKNSDPANFYFYFNSTLKVLLSHSFTEDRTNGFISIPNQSQTAGVQNTLRSLMTTVIWGGAGSSVVGSSAIVILTNG